MSKQVQIGSNEYTLPTQGTNPSDKGTKRSWGENLSDIVEALIIRVNSLFGPSDIAETAEVILNTAGAKQIVLFYYNATAVRSFESPYNLSRTITKSIQSYTGDGVTTTITLAYNHDLKNGDTISITNTSGQIDGVFAITKINDTSFSIASTFNGTNTVGKFIVELLEYGTLFGAYSAQGWELAQTVIGDAQVTFDIDNAGFITYDPVVLSGDAGSYSGVIRFFGKALLSA